MTTFDERIAAAFSQLPADAITQLKAAVMDELLAADKSLSIETTGYFNHSYLPDLVATWGSSSGREARPYYLRPRLSPDGLREDTERLGVDSPAIIGLIRSEAETDLIGREVAVTNPTTLVVEGSAIGDLAAAIPDDDFAALVPVAVVRAGRGYLDSSSAADLAGAAESGFEAAAVADADATRTALGVFRRHLPIQESIELERTLGVVWASGGGERDAFPAEGSFDSSPLPGTLRRTLGILFSRGPIDNDSFWDRLAGWIGVDDLLSFGELEPSPNLQRLMSAASSQLKFVSVSVGAGVSRLSHPEWSVGQGGLLLSDSAVNLHFVTDGRAHSNWPEQYEPPRWNDLKARLDGFEVDRAEFDSGAVSVRVDSKSKGGDESQDEVLASIQGMSGLGSVREIVVRSSSGNGVRCRMACRVATMERSAKIPADELGWVAISVLADADASDLDRLGSILGRGDAGGDVTEEVESLT